MEDPVLLSGFFWGTFHQNLLFVLHISEWTLDLYIFSLALVWSVWRVMDFQVLVSLLKICAAMPILVEISFFNVPVCRGEAAKIFEVVILH